MWIRENKDITWNKGPQASNNRTNTRNSCYRAVVPGQVVRGQRDDTTEETVWNAL